MSYYPKIRGVGRQDAKDDALSSIKHCMAFFGCRLL